MIPAKPQYDRSVKLADKRMKVAAYCRVSTELEQQESSYEAPVEYYTNKIEENPNWKNAGIYADDGKSATNTKKRDDFNAMIGDALDGKIESFLPINSSILIFDDLERCDCSINEILGYINSFVEHEKMKVIIVANQEEIGKSVTEKGRELQYLVAAGGRDIEFEPKKEEDVILQFYRSKNENSNEEKQKEPIHVEQLTERVDKLFGKNLAYEKKEKN